MKTAAPTDFRLVNPEMFTTFVEVSFHKLPTNISNDMMKKLIFSAALLLAGGAVAAQPKVIAHRGYWTAPESAQNSLASFTKADAVGVYGSEIDVWLTADNKLIVNHDRKYKGTDIDMEKSTAKEITAIVLPNGENIPTFDAYLKLVASKPDTRLILEMKSLSDYNREDLAAEKIVRELKKYKVLERTDIIAFSINACLAFKKLLPDTRIYYLNGDLSASVFLVLDTEGNWTYFERADGDAEAYAVDSGYLVASNTEITTYYAYSTEYDDTSYRVFEFDKGILLWGEEGITFERTEGVG